MDDSNAPYAIVAIVYLLMFGSALLFSLGFYVVWALSLMKLFEKVGISKGIAWVPIYNIWKLLELGGQPGWLALLTFVPFGSYVTSVFMYIGMYRTGFAFRKDGSFLVLGIFLPFVWAFMLGGRDTVYEPQLITQRGFPPPLAGYGSVTPEVQAQWKAYFAAQRAQQYPPAGS